MSNELLYNQLYERTKDFGRSQFVKEIMRLERENNQLKEQYCERTDCCGRLGNSKKVEKLQQENKELKEELQKADSITQSCIFNGKKESELNFRQSLNLVKELRQENKELQEKYNIRSKAYNNILLENASLHNKIDKAIEYVKKNKYGVTNSMNNLDIEIYIDTIVKLLKDSDVDE